MALQIRRGTAAQRTSVTPAEGELLYTTDTKLVYVGDGSTAGGNIISGGGGGGDVVSDTSPQLGGDLDLNNFKIISTGNADINIDPAGNGDVVLHGDFRITEAGNITKTGQLNITPTSFVSFGNNSTLVDGNVFISRNSYSPAFGAGFTFAQHHATADAVNFTFYRTRGTGLAPTAVNNGDDIADINFFGQASSGASGAAAISVSVEGTPGASQVPGKISFLTNNGTSTGVRAELSAAGTWKINTLGGLSGTSVSLAATNTISAGNIVFSENGVTTTANTNLPITASGADVVIQGSLEVNSSGNLNKTGELNIAATSLVSFGNNAAAIDGNVFITRNTFSSTFGAGFTFAQHHEISDAVNFTFYRTRGTATSVASVQNGDDLADITFQGWDGTQRIAAATMTTGVDGSVSTGKVPGKFQFFLHDGITSGLGGIKLRAEMRADGNFRIDKLAGLSGSNITIDTGHTVSIGDVRLSASGLSTVNSNANLYITASSAGRVYLDNLAWPTGDGGVNQVLTTNGAGSLYWSTPGAGTGLGSRSTAFATTGSLADAATGNITITGYKAYALLKLETSAAAWVRVYTSVAARVADATRAEGVDPAPGAGVLAEVVTTGAQTILMSPGLFGWNDETVPTTSIELAVTNKSGSTTTITVTLTLVQLES